MSIVIRSGRTETGESVCHDVQARLERGFTIEKLQRSASSRNGATTTARYRADRAHHALRSCPESRLSVPLNNKAGLAWHDDVPRAKSGSASGTSVYFASR